MSSFREALDYEFAQVVEGKASCGFVASYEPALICGRMADHNPPGNVALDMHVGRQDDDYVTWTEPA
jgi:hypothetical protein